MNNLGLATLERAKIDLDKGIYEDLGPNDGHRIREYAANYGLKPPINWCAVALCTWLKEACQALEVDMPIVGSAAAQGVMSQFIKIGIWTPKKAIGESDIIAGNVPIWSRPPKAWMGHIGIIELTARNKSFYSIEGNSGPKGDKVACVEHYLDDARLLGIGRLTEIGYTYWNLSCEPICSEDPLSNG